MPMKKFFSSLLITALLCSSIAWATPQTNQNQEEKTQSTLSFLWPIAAGLTGKYALGSNNKVSLLMASFVFCGSAIGLSPVMLFSTAVVGVTSYRYFPRGGNIITQPPATISGKTGTEANIAEVTNAIHGITQTIHNNPLWKVLMLSSLIASGTKIFEAIFVEPFTPEIRKALQSYIHPPLLEGEKSFNYALEQLQVCSTPFAKQIISNIPFLEACPLKQAYIPFDKMIFNQDIQDKLKNFMKIVTRRQKQKATFPNLFLYGPHGTGKTAVVKAMAEELGFNYQKTSASSILSLADGSTQIKRAFSWAERDIVDKDNPFKDNRPVIFFIDEFEALGVNRKKNKDPFSASYQAMSEFLSILNSWGSKKYLVVAGSNLPDPSMLDPAIVSRFDMSIEIALPDTSTRRQLFKMYLSDELHITNGLIKSEGALRTDNLDQYAELSEGFSGRDIMSLCRSSVNYVDETRDSNKLTADMVMHFIDDTREKYEVLGAHKISTTSKTLSPQEHNDNAFQMKKELSPSP